MYLWYYLKAEVLLYLASFVDPKLWNGRPEWEGLKIVFQGLPGKLHSAFLGGKLQAFILIFQMNQLSSMVKTFVEGQESMLESLDEMIERQSQDQVSRIHCARTDFCFVSSGLHCHHY